MADFETDMTTEEMIERMRTLSHSDYQAAATRLENLLVEVRLLRKLLQGASARLRSATAIALREGRRTYWQGFLNAVRRELEQIHPVLYPDIEYKNGEFSEGSDDMVHLSQGAFISRKDYEMLRNLTRSHLLQTCKHGISIFKGCSSCASLTKGKARLFDSPGEADEREDHRSGK